MPSYLKLNPENPITKVGLSDARLAFYHGVTPEELFRQPGYVATVLEAADIAPPVSLRAARGQNRKVYDAMGKIVSYTNRYKRFPTRRQRFNEEVNNLKNGL